MQGFYPFAEENSGSWAVILNKGYGGSAGFCREIITKKNLPMSSKHRWYKENLDALVRPCDRKKEFWVDFSLWMVMGSNYRWNEHLYYFKAL